MATLLLTDKAVTGAKAGPKQRLELWDTHTPGLCLRVSGGTKAWVVRYRANGKQRRFVLGDAPVRAGDPGMALADARIKAASILRAAKREGADPAGERLRSRAEAKAQPIKTFNDLADAYLQACRNGEWKPRGKRQSPRTIKDAEESLDRYVRPELGELPLGDISRVTVRKMLRGLVARGIGAQANKAVGVVGRIYAYAIAEWEGRLVAVNVATGLPREPETPRTRILSDVELKALWGALLDPSGLSLPPEVEGGKPTPVYLSRSMAILLQLAMLLLQRRGELAGMMLSELNLEQALWLIPAERMKGRRPHLVPLPPAAVALIREAVRLAQEAQPKEGARPNDFPIFPSPRDRARAIRPGTVTHALAPIMKALAIEKASVHDIRRTGSTIMTSERLGISPFIRSRVLSHLTETGGGAQVSAKHYDPNPYIAEKRAALAAWEGLLLDIVAEQARPPYRG